jgi:hypothetical protein
VEPTTLHEITRRYYATAVALAKAMGLPLTETFLRDYRESISTCFIEAGKAGVRLPPAVQLPPLVIDAPVVTTDSSISSFQEMSPDGAVSAIVETFVADMPDVPLPTATTGQAPLPTHVPPGYPAADRLIADLSPGQLRLCLAKSTFRMTTDPRVAAPLQAALTREHARRLAAGAKDNRPEVNANGT